MSKRLLLRIILIIVLCIACCSCTKKEKKAEPVKLEKYEFIIHDELKCRSFLNKKT